MAGSATDGIEHGATNACDESSEIGAGRQNTCGGNKDGADTVKAFEELLPQGTRIVHEIRDGTDDGTRHYDVDDDLTNITHDKTPDSTKFCGESPICSIHMRLDEFQICDQKIILLLQSPDNFRPKKNSQRGHISPL